MTTLWMTKGDTRLGFVPELGGRLLSVQFRGREVLWRNDKLLDDELGPRGGHEFAPNRGRMGDWVNYGGDKTWPAPQGWHGPGQWAGPPDPVLDSGPYATTVDGDTITMTSAVDQRTGLWLRRRFVVRDNGYEQVLTAHNASLRNVRWALWNVTQLPPGVVRVGMRTPDVVNLASGTGNPQYLRHDDEVVVPVQEVVGKLGFPGTAGWFTHTSAHVSLTQRFAVRDAEYPDENSPFEVWIEHPLPEPLAHLGDLDPPAHIVECEVLGPLTTLQPGESTELVISATLDTKA